ncbi:MAG: arginine deiminase family protein [Rhizobiaceae bacterium]|nr:arginine deiminase family protein [Rhizobiaceae bacterium]
MSKNRCFQFSRAITRSPAPTVVDGLRDGDGSDPDFTTFQTQHKAYIAALEKAGVKLTRLPQTAKFPDSVFIEDAAICLQDAAIVLRPGAPSRFGEAEFLRPVLEQHFSKVIDLPGDGTLDGGDVLLTNHHAFIGLSERTNQAGFDALASILLQFDYQSIKVETPSDILHFKTDCGLLDEGTIFATKKLAATGCFSDYRVIEVPEGEEAAANIVRINDVVFLSSNYPNSKKLLQKSGYNLVTLDISEPAKIDGGLSCMSLRF